MGPRIFYVDAFTDKAFGGNPAAVCVLNEGYDESWMQNVAHEMNLSETAFLHAQEDGYDLRWFTPSVEVDLCGHATLASAHILWESGFLSPKEQARFHTRSGLLKAERKGEWIELNFPATPDQSTSAPSGLEEALGVPLLYIGKSKFDFLVEVDKEQTVRSLEPDFRLLEKVKARGIIVTSQATSTDYDFVSRFFAPSVGINEDPVTGSAHCCLGPFWSKRLCKKELAAYQASKRGGVLRVRVADERVYISGKAITVLNGELSDCL